MDQNLPPLPPLRQMAIFLSALCLLFGLVVGFAVQAWGMLPFLVAMLLGIHLARIAAWHLENHPQCHTRYEMLFVIFSLHMLSMAVLAAHGAALLKLTLWSQTFAGLCLLGFGLTAYELWRHRTGSPTETPAQV